MEDSRLLELVVVAARAMTFHWVLVEKTDPAKVAAAKKGKGLYYVDAMKEPTFLDDCIVEHKEVIAGILEIDVTQNLLRAVVICYFC